MRRLAIYLLALIAMAPAARGAEPIDFDTQIMPILSRYGCNAAECHGGAAGRGGFRLSLFGGDPQHDYRAIVHELEGRRVNLASAAESLLIAKPGGAIDHGGDVRFDAEGPVAARLTAWIEQGAPRGEARRLTSLSITPAQVTVESLPAEFSLRVFARFDDGPVEEVTGLALFSSNDEGGVTIDAQGRATVVRPGRHVLVVRYLDRTVPVLVTAPFPARTPPQAERVWHNWIDDHIQEVHDQMHLTTGPLADDATFLRRVTLDLVGRLPSPEEVTEFLADPNPEKRSRKIDALLDSPEYVTFWRYRVAKWLRLAMPGGDRPAAEAMFAWLEAKVRDDAPWDATARELIAATGDSHRYGPAGFHRLVSDARQEAELVSETMMGVRLRCANCHNHPLDRWTQDDYHGLAAVFATLDRGREVAENPLGSVSHPRTEEAAVASLPGVEPGTREPVSREEFAKWLTGADNPYFRRAMVNRLWQAMMGRGLVEPVDDLRATNPASHPELLERLADEFSAEGYRIKPMLRLLARSATYQRGEAPEAAEGNRFYTHAARRPLDAEVAADAIAEVTGIPESYARHPVGTRAIELVDPNVASEGLDLLGRCVRGGGCTEEVARGADGLAERLHLLNGPLLNQKLRSSESRLRKLIAAGKSDGELVEEFYVRAFARRPSEEELQWWTEQLAGEDRESRLEDFVWSLLNSSEFLSNH